VAQREGRGVRDQLLHRKMIQIKQTLKIKKTLIVLSPNVTLPVFTQHRSPNISLVPLSQHLLLKTFNFTVDFKQITHMSF